VIDHILRGLLREVPRDQHTEARRLIGLSHNELVRTGRTASYHPPVEILVDSHSYAVSKAGVSGPFFDRNCAGRAFDILFFLDAAPAKTAFLGKGLPPRDEPERFLSVILPASWTN